MAVTVRIPTPLRKMAGEKPELSANAGTVREVLVEVGKAHPELGARLTDDAGTLRRYVNFFVNENDIRDLQGADTPLKDGDTLSIMPAIAGG